MLLTALGDRRIVLVSGKGGVGKTSVASALALARAEAGARVLLVSTDPAHNLGHVWDHVLGDEPRRVWNGAGRVDAVEIDPQATVDRHLATVASTMRRLLPERLWTAAERHLDLARDAPGTHESAVLERIAEVVETGLADHDLTIVDTAPTGHTLRLMTLPDRLTVWTESLLANRDRSERFGAVLRGLGGEDRHEDRDAELRRVLVRRRDRFAALRDVITDADTCTVALVLTAERTPVLETLALHERLHELGIDVGAVVVNRRSPDESGLLSQRRDAEERHLADLRSAVEAPIAQLPWLGVEPVGLTGLRALAQAAGTYSN